MKFQHLLDILFILLQGVRVTASDLAKRLNISVRTVFRYMDELSVAGIPVIMTKGKGGGIELIPQYRLPAGYFTLNEYTALESAAKAMLMQTQDPALFSAIEKLHATVRPSVPETICGNILVDESNWGDRGAMTKAIKDCEKAVNESLRIVINYMSREGEGTTRTVDPHIMILKHGVWYIYAYCHMKNAYRTFKIGRIKEIRFTGEKFVKARLTTADIPLDFWYDESVLTEITLEMEKKVMPLVEDWLSVTTMQDRGDKIRAYVKLPENDETINKILSFGGDVRVLTPTRLRKKIKDAAYRVYSTF